MVRVHLGPLYNLIHKPNLNSSVFLRLKGNDMKKKKKGNEYMPELPEMENYRLLLNQKIAGQIITQVQINREKSINVNPALFINTVSNQKVLTVNICGCSLVVKLQPSKLLSWVRFPSPAPYNNGPIAQLVRAHA